MGKFIYWEKVKGTLRKGCDQAHFSLENSNSSSFIVLIINSPSEF